MEVPPARVLVPNQRPLAPSVASVTSVANDKGYNEWAAVAVHGAMDCGQKSFKLVWRCHQLLPGFLTKGHLPRVLRQSRRSVMIKGDNEMILGAVYRSPGICLTADENPRKPQLGDRLMKGLCNQSSAQMGSLTSK